jgi:hypothetical protein
MACATKQGGQIGAATAFRHFRQTARGNTNTRCEAIHAASASAFWNNIVTTSVYTTQSITSVMKKSINQGRTPAPHRAIRLASAHLLRAASIS